MKSLDAPVGETTFPACSHPSICIFAVFCVADVSWCRFHSVYVRPATDAKIH